MDNNMEYKSFTEKEEIILKKDGYLINKENFDLFGTDDKISNNIEFIDNEIWEAPLQ
jgi:hypothetical protein